jgi:threonine dehydratase
MLPTPDEVLAAAERLTGVIVRTPLIRSGPLSRQLGREVYLKCEQLQTTGSFKLRGAYNALASLSEEQRSKGVVASSAGNHGLGLSYAARKLGVKVKVFIPADAPAVKRDGIRALGAEIDMSQPHYDEAHHAAIEYARENALPFINPCAGESILAGQGTIAVEVLEELPDVRSLVVPFGGGGLFGGIGAFLRARAPNVRLIAAQGDRSDALARSLAAGHRVDVIVEPTLADGLSGQVDDVGFAIGQFAVDEMRVVTETEIEGAIAWLAREHDTRVEGSGAASVAALLATRFAAPEGPVVAVLSGGNIDEERWKSIIASASAKE